MANPENKNELKTIIDTLNEQGKMAFIEGAKEAQIADFEKKFDIRFPDLYRRWLLFSDGGECFLPAGVQFYGVAHKPIIDMEDEDKPSGEYVVIGTLSNGDPIVFEKGKDAVSIYNLEADRIEEDETYEDFFAFLKDLYETLGIDEED